MRTLAMNETPASKKLAAKKATLEAKAAKLDAKIRAEKAKLERAEAKRQAARKWIPDTYPSWGESNERAAVFNPPGFDRIQNQDTFEKVLSAMQEPSLIKVFDSLADTLACDKASICLVQSGWSTWSGKKADLLYFRYQYNPDFNSVLKDNGARFRSQIKTWCIPVDDEGVRNIIDEISDFYTVIVDLDDLIILKNEKMPSSSAKTQTVFKALPFHINIKKDEIVNAILAHRSKEEIKNDRIYVNTGDGFAPLLEQEIWSQAPFLLLRYSVEEGRPRYVCFSTLGKSVEQVSFGNDTKKTARYIARYMDTCKVLRIPAYTIDKSKVLVEKTGQRQELQWPMHRFSESIEDIRAAIPDLGFAVLCSDYVSMATPGYGADSEDAGIVAYVVPSLEHGKYLHDIKIFFGHPADDYPVIFTRANLDIGDDDNDCVFGSIMAHELAHWLVIESVGEFNMVGGVHGIAWAICTDLLGYAFFEDYTATSFEEYNPNMISISASIYETVSEIGIEAILEIKKTRALSKVDIKHITRQCYEHMSEKYNIPTLVKRKET